MASSPARSPRPGVASRRRDYSPTQWNMYFTECQDVDVGSDKFRVYRLGNTGPVLILLHGGGFSALTWSLFSVCITSAVECCVVAIDLRGHGDTHTADETDLSAETMSKDVQNVVAALFGFEPPPIILIGHSMGGALCVHIAYTKLIPSLIAIVVIDIVEGTAMDALASMQSFLRTRPSYFPTIEHAIEWCVRSGQVRNRESAKVSVPGQIKCVETGKVATQELSLHVSKAFSNLSLNHPLSIKEEEDGAESFSKPATPLNKYTWRIDLGQTERFWSGWFKGLSSMFLSCPIPKMLILAGVDRLDKELTIGQMQGKFQMIVLAPCGHAVHEDLPDKVADIIGTFLVRFRFSEPKANFKRCGCRQSAPYC